MDVLILLIGVVGLSLSGWILRGYFIHVPPIPEQKPAPGQDESQADLPTADYVSAKEHQQVLQRLEQLEKTELASNVEKNSVEANDTLSLTKSSREGLTQR